MTKGNVALISAFLTAATTLGVTALNRSVPRPEQRASEHAKPWVIRGQVSDLPGRFDVFLVPSDNMGDVDNKGAFSFENVAPGTYFLVVRSDASGTSRWLINPKDTDGRQKIGHGVLEYGRD